MPTASINLQHLKLAPNPSHHNEDMKSKGLVTNMAFFMMEREREMPIKNERAKIISILHIYKATRKKMYKISSLP